MLTYSTGQAQYRDTVDDRGDGEGYNDRVSAVTGKRTGGVQFAAAVRWDKLLAHAVRLNACAAVSWGILDGNDLEARDEVL